MFDAPRQVLSLMRSFNRDWFVAGGWAIDLYLEKETRAHADIEIAVFRRDQLALQNHFAGWNFKKASNGALTDWNRNELLKLPIHEIHCFREPSAPPSLEVLLNETDGDEWLYRRNKQITKPIAKLSLTSNLGMKFLRPEIVLLYKSKNPRPKDERDFETVVEHLDDESREWLKNALTICGSSHHWLPNL